MQTAPVANLPGPCYNLVSLVIVFRGCNVGRIWQLQDAKSRFSEVVDEAIENGPQIVSRRGVEVAVVLSYKEYRQLKKSQVRLGDFFSQSPLAGAEDLDLERDRSLPGPDIEL